MGLADRLGKVTGSTGQLAAGMVQSYEEKSSDFERFKGLVHVKLVEGLGKQLYSNTLTSERLHAEVYEVLQKVLKTETKPLSTGDRAKLVQEVIDDVLGFGPIEPLLRDDTVTEIMVNRFDAIFIERRGHIVLTDLRFTNELHLREVIDRIVSKVGRRVDEASPLVDARLADGSRINAVVAPVAVDGSSLTIRKFAKDILAMDDLVKRGTISAEAMEFLALAVKGKQNILISGGTGSGKTTTLNVMSSFIPPDERIITIEDSAELKLEQPHVLRLESRPANIEGAGAITIRDLVKNALRMRPDRIVVGEVRDQAALDMLQAMNTGHEGSLSTVHANSSRDALSRIETMVLTADLQLPIAVIREQIVGAIDLVVHQARLRDGSRHIMTISEITGRDGDNILMQDIFAYKFQDPTAVIPRGELVATGMVPECLGVLLERGVDVPKTLFRKK